MTEDYQCGIRMSELADFGVWLTRMCSVGVALGKAAVLLLGM